MEQESPSSSPDPGTSAAPSQLSLASVPGTPFANAANANEMSLMMERMMKGMMEGMMVMMFAKMKDEICATIERTAQGQGEWRKETDGKIAAIQEELKSLRNALPHAEAGAAPVRRQWISAGRRNGKDEKEPSADVEGRDSPKLGLEDAKMGPRGAEKRRPDRMGQRGEDEDSEWNREHRARTIVIKALGRFPPKKPEETQRQAEKRQEGEVKAELAKHLVTKPILQQENVHIRVQTTSEFAAADLVFVTFLDEDPQAAARKAAALIKSSRFRCTYRFRVPGEPAIWAPLKPSELRQKNEEWRKRRQKENPHPLGPAPAPAAPQARINGAEQSVEPRRDEEKKVMSALSEAPGNEPVSNMGIPGDQALSDGPAPAPPTVEMDKSGGAQKGKSASSESAMNRVGVRQNLTI